MPKKQTVYRPSRLELLPLELREEIYSHLGLPIRHRYPVTCRSSDRDQDCEDPFHNGHFDPKNDRFIRSLLTSITFVDPGKGWEPGYGWGSAEFARVLETSSHERYEDGDTLHLSEYRAIGALVCTNKFIAADVYTLLFSKVEMIFNFQLSNKAVFNYHKGWPRGDFIPCEGEKKNGHYPPEGKTQVVPYRMQLSPFPFLFMTHVTLTGSLGRSFHEEIPHPYLMSRRQRRDKLAKKALSIRYVAQNCPQLESLTLSFSHYERDQGRLKKSYFEATQLALREVARMCDCLKTVKIQVFRKTTSTEHGVVSLLDRDDYQWTEKRFKTKGVPRWVLDDELAEWASGVLTEFWRYEGEVTEHYRQEQLRQARLGGSW
ncbi:hypothetical protein BU16DRAFT_538510 [Lophium mytilinum]|uniref:Uncharacterized protein n=1 Tax=Lophium mytilinum TaxID=390894 RepID=A0A6A6QUN8_9PEZI|nr:hypothetical protein BU16DRAFT_538510 [Lophium mytilinum]